MKNKFFYIQLAIGEFHWGQVWVCSPLSLQCFFFFRLRLIIFSYSYKNLLVYLKTIQSYEQHLINDPNGTRRCHLHVYIFIFTYILCINCVFGCVGKYNINQSSMLKFNWYTLKRILFWNNTNKIDFASGIT